MNRNRCVSCWASGFLLLFATYISSNLEVLSKPRTWMFSSWCKLNRMQNEIRVLDGKGKLPRSALNENNQTRIKKGENGTENQLSNNIIISFHLAWRTRSTFSTTECFSIDWAPKIHEINTKKNSHAQHKTKRNLSLSHFLLFSVRSFAFAAKAEWKTENCKEFVNQCVCKARNQLLALSMKKVGMENFPRLHRVKIEFFVSFWWYLEALAVRN